MYSSLARWGEKKAYMQSVFKSLLIDHTVIHVYSQWFKSSEIKCHSLQPMVVPSAAIHHVSISASSTQVVSEVLSKMLMVGITDPGT